MLNMGETYIVVREALSKKVTFEENPERNERISHVDKYGEVVSR